MLPIHSDLTICQSSHVEGCYEGCVVIHTICGLHFNCLSVNSGWKWRDSSAMFFCVCVCIYLCFFVFSLSEMQLSQRAAYGNIHFATEIHSWGIFGKLLAANRWMATLAISNWLRVIGEDNWTYEVEDSDSKAISSKVFGFIFCNLITKSTN